MDRRFLTRDVKLESGPRFSIRIVLRAVKQTIRFVFRRRRSPVIQIVFDVRKKPLLFPVYSYDTVSGRNTNEYTVYEQNINVRMAAL